MSVSLDSRQMRMMRWLLKQEVPQSTAVMANDLGLTQRVIRYRLTGVEKFLKGRGLNLAKKRGVGIWIAGNDSAIEQLRTEIQQTSRAAPRVFARDERFDLLRASLLFASPEAVSLERLQDELQVSKDVCTPRRQTGRTLARTPGPRVGAQIRRGFEHRRP